MILKILLVLAVITVLWSSFSLISEKIMEKVEKRKEEEL